MHMCGFIEVLFRMNLRRHGRLLEAISKFEVTITNKH